ncbi:MAG TPA: hypothetical protein VF608_08745, partial [Thermoanaerobaculia bacterium]
RKINYNYNDGRLASVDLPEVANTDSDTRPRIEYGYFTAGQVFAEKLELGTNLETIKDPHAIVANGAPRIKFEYENDRVTKQTWATGEVATLAYPALPTSTSIPSSVTTHDILGQERRYTLTASNAANPLADRVHVSELREVGVEIWSGAPFGQLPPHILPSGGTSVEADRVVTFGFEKGTLKSTSQDGVGSTTVAHIPAPGNGLLVDSITTAPPAPAGGGTTVAPVPGSLTQKFRYQSGSAFLSGIQIGDSQIASMQAHRANREPASTNNSITEKSVVDDQGRTKEITSSGGTDSHSAGSKAEIQYFADDDAALHKRGLTRLITEGSVLNKLETTYEYPSERITKEKSPRFLTTTTEVDAWDRPIHVTTTNVAGRTEFESRMAYDASGRVKRVEEWKGDEWVKTIYDYDAIGRRTRVETDNIATVGSMVTLTEYNLDLRQIITRPPGGSFTTVTLDKLGRAKSSNTFTGAQTPIVAEYAYDKAGNQVFTSDTQTASATAFDVHGRAIQTGSSDGTTTDIEYNDLGQPKRVVRRTEAGILFAETKYDYTAEGRVESTSTLTEGTTYRTTDFAWDGGGRTTRTATDGRATSSEFDIAGRLRKSATGAGSASSLSRTLLSSEITPDQTVTASARWKEGNNPSYSSRFDHDGAGNVTSQELGSLKWGREFDKFGNVIKANEPGRESTQWEVDARGAVKQETLPGGATNRYTYETNGAQKQYSDPTSETTETRTDHLGRPLSRWYADNTHELFEWDGSRLSRYEDRAGRL